MPPLITPDMASLLLRLALGTVLLAHSLYLKLIVFTLAGTAQYFESIGLPGFFAYVVFVLEVTAGIAMILGIKTQLFSAAVFPVLVGATWAHFSNGWLFTNTGGGWEYPLFLSVMALVLIILGDGKYSLIKNSNPKEGALS